MTNKTIIVVGASRGIGKSIVELLAQNEQNQILALSRNLNKMETSFAMFTNVKCFEYDLGLENCCQKFSQIIANVNSIDILINNAGLLVNKEFDQLSREDLTRSYQVNVIGVMQTVQSAIKKMTVGHIVNISSMGGYQGSVKFPGLSAYSSSKAALCSFTEVFSAEYKDTEIKMNCLCLGAVQTEMLKEAFPEYQAPISANKMAEFIVHFATTANEWMNGKIIPVSLSTP